MHFFLAQSHSQSMQRNKVLLHNALEAFIAELGADYPWWQAYKKGENHWILDEETWL